MKRTHILAGLTLSGITKSLIQTLIIIVFRLILGVRFFDGFAIVNIMGSIFGILLFVGLF
jgi:ABC-2 type transport system permease protein